MTCTPALLRLSPILLLLWGPAQGATALAQEKGPASDKLAGALAGKPFTVTVDKVEAKKGQPATAHVRIKPAAGWHINKDFPTSLKLRPPAGITPQKAELGKADAKLTEAEGAFDVVLTSAQTGKKSVPGDLRFAVCTDTSCDPQRSPVTIEMNVK